MKCLIREGITAPISLLSNEGGAGIGSLTSSIPDSSDLPEICERRKLNVENHVELPSEIEEQRIEEAKRQVALQDDIKNMNKEFYCECCDKQYKNVTEVCIYSAILI